MREQPNKIKVQFILHFYMSVFSVKTKAGKLRFLGVSANREQKEISDPLYQKGMNGIEKIVTILLDIY